jgi:hypothetical protein
VGVIFQYETSELGAGCQACFDSLFRVTNVKRSDASWARILKHLMEAEKPTFHGKLFFQRSECTAGLTVATIYLCWV